MFANFDFWTVIGIVFTALGTFWGGWAILRPKIAKLLQEFGQLSESVGTALEDNKITKDEQTEITAEFKETKEAFKELLEKNKDK